MDGWNTIVSFWDDIFSVGCGAPHHHFIRFFSGNLKLNYPLPFVFGLHPTRWAQKPIVMNGVIWVGLISRVK